MTASISNHAPPRLAQGGARSFANNVKARTLSDVEYKLLPLLVQELI